MKKRAAFIYPNLYCENVFYEGGSKLNFYIIKCLLQKEYLVDVYCKKSEVTESKIINKLFINNSNFDEIVKDLKSKYDLVISSDLNYASDITYIHKHTYIDKAKKVRNKIANFLYKIFKFRRYLKKLKKFETYKQNAKIVNTVIVSSKELYNDYKQNLKIPDSKLVILPPGIDLIPNDILNYKKNDKTIFGINTRGFHNKGGYELLKAINRLKKESKNFKVKIINQNAKKNIGIQLLVNLYGIRNYIEFLPLQNDMTNFYQSIDFLLMPSLKEPYGMVTIEAMSFGKPAIVSSVSGAKDIIKDGKNGYIADFSGNKDLNLAQKMELAINLSTQEYNVMSNNAYEDVKSLSWDNFSEKYIKIIDAL